jgi:hypothetical protein
MFNNNETKEKLIKQEAEVNLTALYTYSLVVGIAMF